MRCFGLSADRRRCRAEAIGSVGYCEEHREELERNGERIRQEPDARGERASLLSHWRPRSDRDLIPDDARFNVPGWLKRSPVPAVIDRLLHDPNPTTRWLAAFTLRRRRDPGAIEPLWQTLQEDPVSLVRQQSAVALGKIGTLAVIGPLVEALWHDYDAGVRQACAIALGNLRYPTAARELAGMLEREQAAFVRWDCALALGQVGDRAAESLLSRSASADRAEVVRHACEQALADIRRRQVPR